ncbi:transporter substrate-binding domain-containing protein [Moraxella oblonga]|uniref:transporter substrate-binding domain-containing protein n=1 Tax=Moraxella oblonga TaxID=200413 RepID=UPI00082C5CC3|nr:transporter substrate-binding domain-containing protein [Moraxella oblonga]
MQHMTLCIAILSMIGLTACGGDNAQTTAPTDTKPKITTLQIATEGAYAPFNYTTNDGKLAGFDVDLTNALCAKMNVTCEVVAQDWDGIIPALKTGKYDAIVSAMSITPERSEQVAFSEPYFANTLVFIGHKDKPFDDKNTDTLKSLKVAAQNSTIASQWFSANYPDVKIQLYPTLDGAFMDLGSGRADIVISDKLPAVSWLKSDLGKDFALKSGDIDINDRFAIAINPNDTKLLGEFNQALADIKADGTYDKLVVQHFGEAMLDNLPK